MLSIQQIDTLIINDSKKETLYVNSALKNHVPYTKN